MVIKKGVNVKKHYILTVCNMKSHQSLLVFAVSFTKEVLGRSVELRNPPPENIDFFNFECVMQYLKWQIVKISCLKKIEYRAF